MLRAVIFDIDNTLYDYGSAHGVAYQALKDYARDRLALSPEAFDELHRDGERRLREHAGANCAAIHNRLIRYQLMLEQIGAPIAHAPRMADLYWSQLISAMRPYPGVEQLFPRLREMGLAVGIGTNMTADRQFSKLEKLGILGYVDFMVSSEEVSAEKPDRRLFDCCVEKAGVRACECAFVGDSLRGDILGARDAGLHAIWFCPNPALDDEPVPGTVRIRELTELPELIASL